MFCFTKEGPNITICYGVEDPTTPGQPVVPRVILSTTSDQIFDFYYFLVRCGASYYTTNFKYWNDVLTLAQFQAQANRYDAEGGGPAPIWVSTLRTPGDISSIVNPRIGTSWDAGHAFSFTSSPDSLKYVNNDPSYLITTPCPTWIYPIDPDAVSSYNPGTAPSVPTNYDAPQFWQMQDRGSLPAADSTLQSIEYYAYPNAYGSGIQASDSWGLYKDERGARVVSGHANPANRLETDTGVAIPPGSINPIKISTMYAWQYGAQFTWMAGTGPTAQQKINYLHLFVSYIGSPTGVPGLPIDIPGISVQKLTGLFAVSKGSHTDKYNLDAELKIPQPTIRTAYIGK